jgi:hypothetical protein
MKRNQIIARKYSAPAMLRKLFPLSISDRPEKFAQAFERRPYRRL